jgi:hypothetical protein
MALVLADRVQDVTLTTGTGTITLAGTPPTGFQSFAVIGNGNTTYYTIYGGNNWEVGIGTYTSIGTTLTRDTVLASSNSGNLVDFGSGEKTVFVTYPAEKSVNEDAAGNVNINITGSAASATRATNLAAGAAGSVPYQTAANTTAFVATASGVLIGGTTPSFSTTPVLTGTNFTAIPNAALSNSSVTIGSTAVALGATSTTLAGLVSVTLTQDPTLALQAATKQYVDTQTSAGIHFHQPVRVESPTNLNATYSNGTDGVGATLTNAGTQAALVIDGVTLSVADRVLVYEQTDATENGIYVVTSVGSISTNWVLTRSSDANTFVSASPDGLSEGSTVFVQQGTTGAGETYTCTTQGTITFGTTDIVFAQISSAQIYSAGTGLTLSGTQFSLTTPVATTLGGTGLTTFGATNRAIFSSGTTTLTAGTLPIAAGGTAHTSYTDGQLLIGKSSDGSLEKATLTQGTGITITNGSGAITVTNSAPDQTVSLTGGGTTTIGGSYPNFSISSADQYVGTVTSVGGTGTVNGLTLTGTVTSTGSLTLGGTLTAVSLTTAVTGVLPTANGGTNLSSFTSGGAVYATSTSALTTGTLPVASGGTGLATLTANNVLLGNGTSALQAVAPGTTGNVLTSNGTTWVSQAAAPSGPTLTATASGTLANGTTVVVNANGTVSAVAGQNQQVGADAVFDSGNVSFISGTYDTTLQKVVVCYGDNSNSGFGTAIVGTVSGTTITFGTPVVFRSAYTESTTAAYHTAQQKILVAYKGTSGRPTAIVGTVSGTSISFGTAVEFGTQPNTNNMSSVYHPIQQIVLISWRESSTIFGRAASISGTVPTFGTAETFGIGQSGMYDNNALAYNTAQNRILISYSMDGQGRARVIEMVGTQIYFYDEVVYETGGFAGAAITYDSARQQIIFGYVLSGLRVKVSILSGSTLTFGALSTYTLTTGVSSNFNARYDAVSGRVCFNYVDAGSNSRTITGIVSGEVTTFTGEVVIRNSGGGGIAYAASVATNPQNGIVYLSSVNGGTAAGNVFLNQFTNLTASNFIGFSSASYTDGQTATIQVVGSVNTAQTGLTAARLYYVQLVGGIGLTPASPSVYAGMAVSSTRIIVKG